MQNAALSLSREEDSPRDNSDVALFDQCKVTNAPKLFDQDLADHVEERFERQPYTLPRKRRLRPFRGPAGEVAQRYRGGKGYTPIYDAWRPEGLLRVRGRLMAVLVPTEGGGRTVSWADYPHGWSAIQPELPAPYVLRQMIPVSDGHSSEENALGPTIETDERLVPRWTAREARQICLLEREEAWSKAIAWSHRVITSEYRNPDHGDGLSPRAQADRRSEVRCQSAESAPPEQARPQT